MTFPTPRILRQVETALYTAADALIFAFVIADLALFVLLVRSASF